jgi:hypothetical protein
MKNDTGLTDSSSGYDIIVTERHGRFYLRIPELNLIADGVDVATAHAALESARRHLKEKYAAVGEALPPPRDVRLRRTMAEQVTPFLLKAMAVALAGAILMISAAATIHYALRDPLRHAAQKAARAAVLQITAGLEDFAQRDLTPDREERLRNGLRGAVPILRPFIEELQPVFKEGRSQP